MRPRMYEIKYELLKKNIRETTSNIKKLGTKLNCSPWFYYMNCKHTLFGLCCLHLTSMYYTFGYVAP